MILKQLSLDELLEFRSLVGETEHAFFNPELADHLLWAELIAKKYIKRGVIFYSASIDDNTPVGIVGINIETQPNGESRIFAEIVQIGLYEKYRRKGYGSLILKKIEEVATNLGVKGLFLFTGSQNYDNIKFYGKNGYVIDGALRMGRVYMCKWFEK